MEKSVPERAQFDLSNIPKIFLSPSLDLSKRVDFEAVFPFAKNGLKNEGGTVAMHASQMQEKVSLPKLNLQNSNKRLNYFSLINWFFSILVESLFRYSRGPNRWTSSVKITGVFSRNDVAWCFDGTAHTNYNSVESSEKEHLSNQPKSCQ